MNISIIGLGWLGLPLAESFKEKGHSISGTTTSKEKQTILKKQFNVSLFDFNDHQTLDANIYKNTEVVILTIPPFIKIPEDSYGNHLINIVSQFSTNTNFIFTSSTSVYPKNGAIYNEESETSQSSPVTIAENKLKEVLGSKLTILRLGGLYGRARHPVYKIQGKENIKNPKGSINFIHLDDVIESITTIIKTKHFGDTFNLVNPNHPQRKEYYSKLIVELELQPISFDSNREIDPQRIIDASKFLTTFSTNFYRSLFPPF